MKREIIGLYLEKGRLDYACLKKGMFGLFPRSPGSGMQPYGTIRENDYSPLKKFLEGISRNSRTGIYLALPRALFFLREIKLPPMLMEEALTSIQNNLVVYCHLPLQEVYYDVHLCRSDDKGIKGLLFYALRKEIDRSIKIFDEAGKRHLLKGLFPASFGVYAWLRFQGYEHPLALLIPSQEGFHELAVYEREGFVYSASWPLADGLADNRLKAAGAGNGVAWESGKIYSLNGKGRPPLPPPEKNKLGRMPLITENLAVAAVSCAFSRKDQISLDGRPVRRKRFRPWMAFVPFCVFAIFFMGLLTWRSYENISHKSKRLASLEKKVAVTQKSVSPLEARLKALRKSMQVFKDIESYMESNPELYKVINEIAQFLPEGTWFSSLTYERGKLTLRGLTKDALEVQKSLRTSTLFGQAKLVGSVSRVRTGEERFTMTIQLKQEKDERAHPPGTAKSKAARNIRRTRN